MTSTKVQYGQVCNVFVPLSVDNSRRGSTGEKVKILNDLFYLKKNGIIRTGSIIYTKYAINIKSFLNSSSLWCIALPVFVNVCRVAPKWLRSR